MEKYTKCRRERVPCPHCGASIDSLNQVGNMVVEISFTLDEGNSDGTNSFPMSLDPQKYIQHWRCPSCLAEITTDKAVAKAFLEGKKDDE